MRAGMDMNLDTVYGNTVGLHVSAELDNPHMLTNRVLFSDMARMLRYMVEEIRAENERTLLDHARGEPDEAARREVDEAARQEEIVRQRRQSTET